jgi:hypothetical protein
VRFVPDLVASSVRQTLVTFSRMMADAVFLAEGDQLDANTEVIARVKNMAFVHPYAASKKVPTDAVSSLLTVKKEFCPFHLLQEACDRE